MLDSIYTTTVADTTQRKTILDAFLADIDDAPISLSHGLHGGAMKLSRQELFARGCALAHRFKSLGVELGDKVMTILPTGLPFLVSTFGAWCSGAAIVPLAPPTPGSTADYYQKKLASMIRTAKPKVIIASEVAFDALKKLAELTENTVVLRDDQTFVDFTGEPHPPYVPTPEDVAHVQFTSGSTSFPKGALTKHRQLAINVKGIGHVVAGGKPSEDKFVTWLPAHHDMGFIGGLCFPFYHGCELFLIPTETFIRNPAIWLKTISEARATLSPAPTFAYDLLGSRISDTRLQGIDLSSWRYGWIGAEPIFLQTLYKFTEKFRNYGLREDTLKPCYGMAEVTLAVTLTALSNSYKTTWVNQKSLRQSGFAEPSKINADEAVPITCCGVPIHETEVKISDESGKAFEDYRQGRIFVRGSSVMEGYLGDLPSPIDEKGWLDTGDLGFKIGEELYITGRAKDLIIRGGVNIHPQEIEKIADSVENVRMGTATAFSCVRHEIGREEIVLVVETRQQKPEGRKAIVEEIRQKVAQEASVQLDHIELAASGTVPKTTSGKIQRGLCRENFLKQQNN